MSLTANDRLILIRVKIERAKKQLIDLEAELTICRNDYLDIILRDTNPETGQLIENKANVRQLPFNAVATAGDIIHNLRTALDHLANQLVVVGTGGEPSSRQIEFPISKDASTYERDKARKVEGMRPEAIEAIDALKPYRGGNEALWRLHELDNIDKHRTLFTVDRDTVFTAEWIGALYFFDTFLVKKSDPHFAGVFDQEVERDADFELTEAVSNPQISQGYALLPTLHQILDFVERLVFSFKPLLE